MELLVVVVVLSIIASIAVVNYQGYQDRVGMMVDETNEKILRTAVQMDAAETGTIAGSLSELTPTTLEKAYALVINESRPYTVAAFLAEQWRRWCGSSVAEAAMSSFVPSSYYNNDIKVLKCPSDHRTNLLTSFSASGDPNGAVSYAIYSAAATKSYSWLTDPSNDGVALIIESDDGLTRAYRHRHGSTCVEITVGGDATTSTTTSAIQSSSMYPN